LDPSPAFSGIDQWPHQIASQNKAALPDSAKDAMRITTALGYSD